MIIWGDSLEKLKELEPNSVDAVVTDPPYGLSFMGKKWDYDVPSRLLWAEVLRVLKPGGHLLSFGGTRTYHRLVGEIEEGGFEIRDQIMWLYGSGFPKSHDISKAIDKAAGAEREVLGINPSQVGRKTNNMPSFVNTAEFHGAGEINGQRQSLLTAPATEAAKQWEGWGTALKPANEPIVLARKPLSEKTVALNVLKWGTGALNIDGSRIATDEQLQGSTVKTDIRGGNYGSGHKPRTDLPPFTQNPQGRWPANLILDETAAQMLDEQSGSLHLRGNKKPTTRGGGMYGHPSFDGTVGLSESGHAGASRFFYVAKASKRERNAGLEGMPLKEWKDHGYRDNQSTHLSPRAGAGRTSPNQNHHPTVKPIKLMEYLIRLITPPNGIVLDPFMGSGSTGLAAQNLGFDFIGIELNKEYVDIAERRINGSSKRGA